jgi:hypothetical protein
LGPTSVTVVIIPLDDGQTIGLEHAKTRVSPTASAEKDLSGSNGGSPGGSGHDSKDKDVGSGRKAEYRSTVATMVPTDLDDAIPLPIQENQAS